jgi:hypothetical protein
MRRATVLMLLILAPAIAAEDAEQRAGERLWAILSLPCVRSIPEVRAVRRALIAAFFPRWPYRDGRIGYLVVRPWFRRDARLRLFGGTVGVEGGAGAGAVTAASAEIDTTIRLGATLRLERAWSDHRESTAGGALTTWRLFETADSRLRVGTGLRWYSDAERSRIGIAGGAALELFPRPPWSVAAAGELAVVAARAVAIGEATAGWHRRAVELYGGVRLQSSLPSFHGPVVGLRYWF